MHCYATHHIRLYEYQQQNGHVRVEVWQRNAKLTQKSEKFHSSLKTLHYRGESWQCSQVQIIGSTWIADYISVGENLQVLPRFSEAPIASRCIHTITSNKKSIESIADQQPSTWSSPKLTSSFSALYPLQLICAPTSSWSCTHHRLHPPHESYSWNCVSTSGRCVCRHTLEKNHAFSSYLTDPRGSHLRTC